MRSMRIILPAIFALLGGVVFAQQPAPLKTIPLQPQAGLAEAYVPQKLASGELKLVGSRTMSELAGVWTDGFTHVHRDVKPKFDFQGSATIFDALKADAPIVGLLSRGLTTADEEAFAKTAPGKKLIEIDAAFDAIAVVVHKDNPIQGLTFAQLKTLFGKGPDSLTWDAVGLDGVWDETPVARFAPGEGAGARGEFAARVLGEKGEFGKLSTEDWHTKIVEQVAATKGGIGIVSFANSRSDKVRAVPLAIKPGVAFTPLSAETISSGRYPLVRPLSLIVIADDKGGVKQPLVAEFVRYVLSSHGQDDVVKDGFSPLPRAVLLKQYDRLGWNSVK